MSDKAENELCPTCGEGQLVQQIELTEKAYRSVNKFVELHISTCNVCGSDFAGEAEARANKRELIRFHKEVDGLLSGEEIRAIRHMHGITQQQAAEIFGGGVVAFSKYENNDITHSKAMDRLLRVARAIPSAFNWLKSNAGIHQTGKTVISFNINCDPKKIAGKPERRKGGSRGEKNVQAVQYGIVPYYNDLSTAANMSEIDETESATTKSLSAA